jgi:hypothetical protein
VSSRDYAELINLAAEMAQGKDMPSPYWDDHKWYRSTPLAERRGVLKSAEKANDRCRDWAMRIRAVADRLSEQHSGDEP